MAEKDEKPGLAPTATDDPNAILTYLAALSDEEAAAWIEANQERLPAATATALEEGLQREVLMGGTPKYPAAIDAITGKTEDRKGAEKRRQRQIETMSTQLQAEGMDKERADQVAEEQIGAALDNSRPVPELVKAYTGGMKPTYAQENNLVATWNEFNPEDEVQSYDQFLEVISERQNEPLVKQIVDASFTGTDPETVYEWQYDAYKGNGRQGQATVKTLRVSENQFQALKQIYGDGFTAKDVQKLGRIAADIDIEQVVGGQPGWQILAAGAAAMGMWNLSKNETKPELSDAVMSGMGKAGTVTNEGIKKANALTATEINKLRNWGVQFKSGMTRYGQNDSLAFLHAMNPTVAAKVATTKFEALDLQTRRQAYSYMLNAGFSQENLANLGYGWAASFENEGINAPDLDGGAGRIRMVPDKDAIRQATKDLYVQLFRAEPTEDELNKFVGSVSATIEGAAETQSVDGQAQIRKVLEADPQYGELYGKKPGGLSEGEYANQFDNAAASILGNQAADPNVIRSGMRSGQYQTTVGAAAASKEAMNNSTWLGRLATAAQLINENT